MRIDGPVRANGVANGRRTQKKSDGDGFSLGGETSPERSPQAHAGAAIGGVDAILALQSLGDDMPDRRRAVAHGNDLLDELTKLKIEVLEGKVSHAGLTRLARLVRQRPAGFLSPDLAGVLAEIDLRVQVELAKLGIDAI